VLERLEEYRLLAGAMALGAVGPLGSGLAATTTTLSSSANPSALGQPVTFTAVVTATGGGGTPTGTVEFYGGPNPVLDPINIPLVPVGPGQAKATLVATVLFAGTHTIEARYSGDATFAPGETTVLTQIVAQATSSVALTSSENPSAFGDTVDFTALITPSIPYYGPSDSVTFSIDGTPQVPVPVLEVNGQSVATLADGSLTVGSHVIGASFSGDSNIAGSQAMPLSQVVNPASSPATITTLSSSVNPSASQQAVTFTATVSPSSGSGTPTGTVSFTIDGTVQMPPEPLTVVDGQDIATFTDSALGVGTHTVIATYSGDGTFTRTSTSTPLAQIVNAAVVPINEFALPTLDSAARDITTGPDGNLWFIEAGANQIGMINPATHVISEFPIPTPYSGLTEITSGPDRNLWFNEGNVHRVGTINPTTHVINEFATPTLDGVPFSIATDPDGNLLFIEYGIDHHQIVLMDPTTHVITEIPIPEGDALPVYLTTGRDGNLWFTAGHGANAPVIGTINLTTHGTTEFPIAAAGGAWDITTGPDGNLWFLSSNGLDDQIGTFNPTTGVSTEFPIPTRNTNPGGLTTGPDGNLWFVEEAAGRIARFNPATHAITEFAIPGPGPGPFDLTTGPDGNLWFTLDNRIGQLDPALATSTTGTTVITTPTSTSGPLEVLSMAGVDHSRKGASATSSSISIKLDAALNPRLANHAGLYTVRGVVNMQGKLVFGRTLRIRSVVYQARSHTVTIHLARPYKGLVEVEMQARLVEKAGS
jgi:virginiamycin B lyase